MSKSRHGFVLHENKKRWHKSKIGRHRFGLPVIEKCTHRRGLHGNKKCRQMWFAHDSKRQSQGWFETQKYRDGFGFLRVSKLLSQYIKQVFIQWGLPLCTEMQSAYSCPQTRGCITSQQTMSDRIIIRDVTTTKFRRSTVLSTKERRDQQ